MSTLKTQLMLYFTSINDNCDIYNPIHKTYFYNLPVYNKININQANNLFDQTWSIMILVAHGENAKIYPFLPVYNSY